MNKYHNKKTTIDGITFDSKFEGLRYTELLLLERAGQISNLELQQKFVLIPKTKTESALTYIADFYYIENGAEVIEDVKGMKTRTYINKRKLFKWVYPNIEFREIEK